MDYKSLISIVKKNNLNEYLSVLKGYTMYDKKYALFYLDKRDLLCRVFNGFHNKYVVFENADIEYGRIKKYVIFRIVMMQPIIYGHCLLIMLKKKMI